jgi:hypothetical protein
MGQDLGSTPNNNGAPSNLCFEEFTNGPSEISP